MTERLADRFASAGGAAIEVDGQLAHMLYELDPMATPTRLSINLTSTSPTAQGLRLKARGGTIAVDGRNLDDIVLWTDTAPALSTVVLVPSDRSAPLTLRVWNVWRDPAATMQAWIGDAGIVVDGESPERVVLRCSDGFDAPTFDDLVVELALSAVTTNHAVTASGSLSFEVRDELEHARDRLARVLSRMDGKSSYSIVLWELPPGKRLDEVDEGEVVEYVQCAGSREAMCVEIRTVTDGAARQSVIGRSHRPRAGEPDVTIPWDEFEVKVFEDEVFDAAEATELFAHYLVAADVPPGFSLRRLRLG
jgi:hypothetical protein